jgi:glycosyltransferase involved in cell wall biosynthesis
VNGLDQGSMRSKVYILNPYIPEYRLPFFVGLQEKLNASNVDMEVITGFPNASFRQREDFSTLPFHRERKQISFKILGMEFRYLFGVRDLSDASAVVYEYSITNINSWLGVLKPKPYKILLWGHGPGYLGRDSGLRLYLQKIMAAKADHILTYTPHGRENVLRLEVAGHKVTAVNNTIETAALVEKIKTLPMDEVNRFLKEHSLTKSDKFVAYIGALDKTKRINFLKQVLDQMWKTNPEYKLLVGGSGPERHLLNESIERGQTKYLGRVGDYEKAIISKLAKVLLNPGNTGLLAVDALTMGVPILGTNAPSSPEKDYLKEGESFITLPDDPAAFTALLLKLTKDSITSKFQAQAPKMSDFVANFSEAVLSEIQLGSPKKLLVVTNLPAPYRLSIFNELSKVFDLRVAYTGWSEEGRKWGMLGKENNNYRSYSVGKLFGLGKLKLPFATKQLKVLISESDMVLTGGWHSPAFLTALNHAQKIGKPSFLWFESTLKSAHFSNGPVSWLRQMQFRRADAIFVPGESALEAASQYSNDCVPLIKLNNPIQDAFLNQPFVELKTKAHLTGTRYLYFGRLLELKKVDLLIEAFSLMANSEDTLSIIGDGPMLDKLNKVARKSRVRNQIHFSPGVLDADAVHVYRQHDVLVLPSSREVWGMVAAEALVLGLQVIASDAVGAAKTFISFSTFEEFQNGSVDDLADKMRASRIRKSLGKQEHSKLIDLNSSKNFASMFSLEIEALLSDSRIAPKDSKV